MSRLANRYLGPAAAVAAVAPAAAAAASFTASSAPAAAPAPAATSSSNPFEDLDEFAETAEEYVGSNAASGKAVRHAAEARRRGEEEGKMGEENDSMEGC